MESFLVIHNDIFYTKLKNKLLFLNMYWRTHYITVAGALVYFLESAGVDAADGSFTHFLLFPLLGENIKTR